MMIAIMSSKMGEERKADKIRGGKGGREGKWEGEVNKKMCV